MINDVEFSMVTEKSNRGQKFIFANHAAHVRHAFSTVAEHVSGEGLCLVCKARHTVAYGTTDLRVWSPPCQPYSEMRWHAGGTSSTGLPSEHPQYSITMEDLLELTESDPALITILEQVPAFFSKQTKLEFLPARSSFRGWSVCMARAVWQS